MHQQHPSVKESKATPPDKRDFVGIASSPQEDLSGFSTWPFYLYSNVVTFELDEAEDNVDGPQKQIQPQEMLALHLNAPFISIPAHQHFFP